MVEMNEKKIIRISLALSSIILAAVVLFLYTVKIPGISRIPVQGIYSQGIALNFYVNYILPAVIVLAILFIAGLSTFGLYHEATREQLGTRPLFLRFLDSFMGITSGMIERTRARPLFLRFMDSFKLKRTEK